MADKKEKDLAVPGSIDIDNDSVRMLTGDVSVKQDFAVVAEAIIEQYEGSTLGAEPRSVKEAFDNFNYVINDQTTGLQARSVTADELTALEDRLGL